MIEFQIGDRKTGKSTLLLQWLVQSEPGTRRVIITHSRDAADDLYRRALEMKLNIDPNQFICYSDTEKLRGMRNVEVGVDNIDLLLGAIFHHRVLRVTATGVDILREVSA